MVSGAQVAFVLPDLAAGGAQRVTVTIANGLADRGLAVDLVVPRSDGPFRDAVAADVSVVALATPRVRPLGILASLPALRRYLTRVAPPIVFSEMTYVNVVALLAAWGLDPHIVPTEHLVYGQDESLRARVADRLASRLYGSVDRLVAVSNGVADSVARETGIDRSAIEVIYNPVPIEEIRAQAAEPVGEPWLADAETPTVLSVGRLAPQKDQATLLRAFATVHEREPSTRLIVVGEGPRRDRLQRLARSLELESVCSFPGYVDNVYAYMASASVFALSSRFEGLPTVLIEALACGCPIVATDCPSGPREILADGDYGTLVPVGDPEALADALKRDLSASVDPDRLRARARAFDVDAAVSAYASLIEEETG